MQRTYTTTQSQPCNNLTFTLKHFIFEYLTSKYLALKYLEFKYLAFEYPALKNLVFKYLHLLIEQPSHARKKKSKSQISEN